MHAHDLRRLVPVAALLLGCGGPVTQASTFWPVLQGRFDGTYTIIHGYSTASPRVESGPAHLEIQGQHYEVYGDRYLPPPGCGTVQVGKTVHFADECFHLANFDWTLIIQGDFAFSRAADRVILERVNQRFDRFERFDLGPAS
jgi:hypothetical protein